MEERKRIENKNDEKTDFSYSPISNSDALNAVIVTILGISPFIPLLNLWLFLVFCCRMRALLAYAVRNARVHVWV